MPEPDDHDGPSAAGRSGADPPRATGESSRTRGDTVTRRSLLRATGAGAVAPVPGVGMAGRTGGTGGPATPSAQTDLPRLAVEDGELVAAGEPVTLRGLNVIDPKRANRTAPVRGRDAAQQFDLLTDAERGWHPDVIRVPVQPVDVGEHRPGHGPEPPAFDDEQLATYLETHLDPVIDQCAEAGVYAIVDFHRHRDVAWGDQDAGTVNEPLREETIAFWRAVAPRYADRDHVLYEAFNEPTEPGMWGEIGQAGVDDVWHLFLEFVQPIVDEIRGHTDTVTLVGSPGWSQSPEGALIEPVAGENLAYTYHVYPGHEASQQGDWEDSSIGGQGVEGVYEEVPVFVTEFGWRDSADDLLGGTTRAFGRPFLEWLESHPQLHWTAWCADVLWDPRMFETGFDTSGGVDPYTEEVPEDCPERPCEWRLLGRDAGSAADMGEYVRQALEVEGVPADYLEPAETGGGGTEGDGDAEGGGGAVGDGEEADGGGDGGTADRDSGDVDGDGGDDGVTDPDPDSPDDGGAGAGTDDGDGLPGFGALAGVAGVAGGLAALLGSDRATDAAEERTE